MTSLIEELKSLIDELDEDGIDYALCGGLSLAVHGYPRATLDIDLLVRPEQLDRAIQAGGRLGFDIRGKDLSFKDGTIEIRRISKLDSEGEVLSLDLILTTSALAAVWDGREAVDLEGRRLWVVSRQGLSTMKRMAGRPQDLADLERIENAEN